MNNSNNQLQPLKKIIEIEKQRALQKKRREKLISWFVLFFIFSIFALIPITGYMSNYFFGCKLNLKRLFNSYRYAIFIFENDHKRFPDNLEELYEKDYLKKEINAERLPKLKIKFFRYADEFYLECSIEHFISRFELIHNNRSNEKFKTMVNLFGKNRNVELIDSGSDNRMFLDLSMGINKEELGKIEFIIDEFNKGDNGFTLGYSEVFPSPFLGKKCRGNRELKLYKKVKPKKFSGD